MGLDGVVIVIAEGVTPAIEAATGSEEALAAIRLARQPPDGVLHEGRLPTAGEAGSSGRWARVIAPTARAAGSAGGEVRRVPVNVGRRAAGSLLLSRARGAAAFSEADSRLLSAVASQIGIAVERARLREEAMEAEVLRRTDELRRALLNAVSHDLLTPLASIIANAGSLLQEDVRWSDEDRHDFAEAIEREAERLSRVVGNLLDLSRIEAGAIQPEWALHDVGSLIDEVVARLGLVARGRTVVVDVPDGLPPVSFDYVEIDQVLSNLVENAAKYGAEGTEIGVSARVSGGEVEIEVADRGAGISPAAMPHLFDAFYRAPSAVQMTRGSGLGLAVAKGLVEAHGGRIRAKNREGGGARFSFTLPLNAPVEEPLRLKESAG